MIQLESVKLAVVFHSMRGTEIRQEIQRMTEESVDLHRLQTVVQKCWKSPLVLAATEMQLF
jgi:hypothetical protein